MLGLVLFLCMLVARFFTAASLLIVPTSADRLPWDDVPVCKRGTQMLTGVTSDSVPTCRFIMLSYNCWRVLLTLPSGLLCESVDFRRVSLPTEREVDG